MIKMNPLSINLFYSRIVGLGLHKKSAYFNFHLKSISSIYSPSNVVILPQWL